jgi:hypothetical protein
VSQAWRCLHREVLAKNDWISKDVLTVCRYNTHTRTRDNSVSSYWQYNFSRGNTDRKIDPFHPMTQKISFSVIWISELPKKISDGEDNSDLSSPLNLYLQQGKATRSNFVMKFCLLIRTWKFLDWTHVLVVTYADYIFSCSFSFSLPSTEPLPSVTASHKVFKPYNSVQHCPYLSNLSVKPWWITWQMNTEASCRLLDCWTSRK